MRINLQKYGNKNIAKDFDFGEKIEVELFENIVENIYTIKENVNFKFPQANNINIAVLALEIIINEMTPNNNGVTKDDIAELLGFTERQGSYYGDLLVYLGFYRKTILNIIQLNYLKNINKKLIEKKEI